MSVMSTRVGNAREKMLSRDHITAIECLARAAGTTLARRRTYASVTIHHVYNFGANATGRSTTKLL